MKKIKWKNLSLASKMLLEVGLLAALLLIMNVGFYFQINQSIQKLDNVYASNVDMTVLADSFEAVQNLSLIHI